MPPAKEQKLQTGRYQVLQVALASYCPCFKSPFGITFSSVFLLPVKYLREFFFSSRLNAIVSFLFMDQWALHLVSIQITIKLFSTCLIKTELTCWSLHVKVNEILIGKAIYHLDQKKITITITILCYSNYNITTSSILFLEVEEENGRWLLFSDKNICSSQPSYWFPALAKSLHFTVLRWKFL